jgi:hypothetical protein
VAAAASGFPVVYIEVPLAGLKASWRLQVGRLTQRADADLALPRFARLTRLFDLLGPDLPASSTSLVRAFLSPREIGAGTALLYVRRTDPDDSPEHLVMYLSLPFVLSSVGPLPSRAYVLVPCLMRPRGR